MTRIAAKYGLEIAAALVVVVAVISGISAAAGSSDAAGQRQRLTIKEAPRQTLSVLAAQKALVAAERQGKADKPQDVLITGQIGGMPNVWPAEHPKFPWYEGQASLFLVDSKVAAQFAVHAKKHGGGHDCAFCQGLAVKNVNAIAVVNFVDERGEIIRVDSRELLDLKENQTVTIRGKARLLGGMMLVVDADGVFVRQ